MHRIEHRLRHDRFEHLPCGRHIVNFVEDELVRVVMPISSTACARRNMTMAMTLLVATETLPRTTEPLALDDSRTDFT